MISLHVYLKPKSGMEKTLESAIKDRWIDAMQVQDGFISAATVTPYSDEELEKLEAISPSHVYEVISFWQTEEQRLAWVARPIHDEVFEEVINSSEELSYTLQTVTQNWKI